MSAADQQQQEGTTPNPLSADAHHHDDDHEHDHTKKSCNHVQPYVSKADTHGIYKNAHQNCDAAKLSAEEYEEETKKIFSSSCYSFSGSMDSQLSADVFDLSKGFPKMNKKTPEVESGGACTNSMLKSLAEHPNITFGDLLCSTRAILKQKGYSQIPQLSVNHQVNLRKELFSVNNPIATAEKVGKKRALIIGINYTGTDGELNGCVNDAKSWKNYLTSQGWDVENPEVCCVITDDPDFTTDKLLPTGENILKKFKWLVEGASSEDSLFLSFSGHGVQTGTFDESEEDYYDENLAPLDFEENGLISDNNVFATLITPLPAKCHFVSVFDCCHSGSVLDLPFVFTATQENVDKYMKGENDNMYASSIFSFKEASQKISDYASGAWDSFKVMTSSAYRKTTRCCRCCCSWWCC